MIDVEIEVLDFGDKADTNLNFTVTYPKVICDDDMTVELLSAKGKNSREIIKKYKKLGLANDCFMWGGLDFIIMFISYIIRGVYFKHLCKPSVLKKNILNTEKCIKKSKKRNIGKKAGCLGAILISLLFVILYFLLDCFVFSVVFVNSKKPYLVAADYQTITYREEVYTRIDELPENAYPTKILGTTIWKDTRTEGLSKLDQSLQNNKVQLFEDGEGNKYLWLVEDYIDTIIGEADNGENKEYKDFGQHYVYVCE